MSPPRIPPIPPLDGVARRSAGADGRAGRSKLLSASNPSDASHRRAGRLRNHDHQPRCLAPRQTHSDLPSSGQRRCSPGPRNAFGARGPHPARLRATTCAMAQQLGAKCSPPPQPRLLWAEGRRPLVRCGSAVSERVSRSGIVRHDVARLLARFRSGDGRVRSDGRRPRERSGGEERRKIDVA